MADVRPLALGVFSLALAACSPGALDLSVDLRTDLEPGVEVLGIETRIEPATGRAPVAIRVSRRTPVATGVRVAEIGGLSPGDYLVEVTLLGAAGTAVVKRAVRVALRASYALTVVVTRDCVSVRCDALTTCVGGRCVDPGCSSADPARCGTVECTDDAECAPGAAPACVVPSCVDGVCLLRGESSRCGPDQYCDVAAGCTATPDAGPPPPDAGTAAPDAGSACAGCGTCDDGDPCTTDACECDHCTHTAAPSGPCDDGDPCTAGDTCRRGVCAGTALDCDDGNPCTDDSCGRLGCAHANNAAACDDGDACTTGDRCAGGACTPTGARVCDDGNDCTDDACTAGACVITPVEGRACDDGRFCTGPDTCRTDGVCRGGTRGPCPGGTICEESSMSCVPF